MEEARHKFTQDSAGSEWRENTLRNVSTGFRLRQSNKRLGSPRVQAEKYIITIGELSGRIEINAYNHTQAWGLKVGSSDPNCRFGLVRTLAQRLRESTGHSWVWSNARGREGYLILGWLRTQAHQGGSPPDSVGELGDRVGKT